MAPKVITFIDYQNAHISAHEMYCGPLDPPHACLIDPVKLSELIVKRRAPGGELAQIRVYRGRPDPRKQPKLASANDQQFSRWMQDSRVLVRRRMLRYPSDWGEADCVDQPREKGIDVSLAIDMARMALEKKYEVGILFSRDTDLLPALEMVRDLKAAHVEVAGWAGSSRLRLHKLWYHELDAADFVAVRDTHYYGR